MKGHPGLIVVVLWFLGVRLLYPVLFVPPSFLGDPEDLVRGTLAHDLIHGGLKVPFWDYLADHYSGGSVAVGLLAVPFFLVFGSTLFALRLVPILFSLATLLVWYALVARNFDRRAAFFTVLFFLLPPSAYLEASSLAMGYHTESMFFSAVAFLLLFEMLRRDDAGLRWPAGLGLTLGFGSWFCYTAFVSVAIVLVWWFWHDHRFMMGKAFAVFLLFFAVGFAAWVPANLSHHFHGLDFLELGLRYDYVRGAPHTVWRIVKITLWYLPTSFVHDPFRASPSLAWAVVDTTLFGSALLSLVARDLRKADVLAPPPASWFFASASVVHVLAVSATRYPMGPYGSLYLAPMLPFFFGAAGVWLSPMWRPGRWPRAATVAVLAVALSGGALGLWCRLDFRWPGASFTMPGYSYGQLAEAIDLRHPDDDPHFASLLPRIERTMTASERSEFLGRRWSHSGYAVKDDAIAAEARRFAAIPEPARSLGHFQLGIALQYSLAPADDATRLAEEHQWISEGARVGRLSRHVLRIGAVPVLDRLPLALDGDTRIVFLDLGTHDSPGEIGWVKGSEEATFLIERAREIGSVEIRLTNGDRPNLATLTSARDVKSFQLAPGQSVIETIDAGPGVLFDGRYYWKISVASRYGHIPMLTRKESDTRYLGVHVVVSLQREARALASASSR